MVELLWGSDAAGAPPAFFGGGGEAGRTLWRGFYGYTPAPLVYIGFVMPPMGSGRAAVANHESVLLLLLTEFFVR